MIHITSCGNVNLASNIRLVAASAEFVVFRLVLQFRERKNFTRFS